MLSLNIKWPAEQIDAFCRKWKVRELSLFGSVLRDDFHPDSDIDLLVSFEPEAAWSLYDMVDAPVRGRPARSGAAQAHQGWANADTAEANNPAEGMDRHP